jgi:hypothetical protein
VLAEWGSSAPAEEEQEDTVHTEEEIRRIRQSAYYEWLRTGDFRNDWEHWLSAESVIGIGEPCALLKLTKGATDPQTYAGRLADTLKRLSGPHIATTWHFVGYIQCPRVENLISISLQTSEASMIWNDMDDPLSFQAHLHADNSPCYSLEGIGTDLLFKMRPLANGPLPNTIFLLLVYYYFPVYDNVAYGPAFNYQLGEDEGIYYILAGNDSGALDVGSATDDLSGSLRFHLRVSPWNRSSASQKWLVERVDVGDGRQYTITSMEQQLRLSMMRTEVALGATTNPVSPAQQWRIATSDRVDSVHVIGKENGHAAAATMPTITHYTRSSPNPEQCWRFVKVA